ncbi:hypothetical protein [Martelella sp. FOR1707]
MIRQGAFRHLWQKPPRETGAAFFLFVKDEFVPCMFPRLQDCILERDMSEDQQRRRVKVECSLCERYGEYREDRFFSIAGTHSAPAALTAFARQMGCPRAMRQTENHFDDRCKIHYRSDGLPSARYLAGERRD